MKISLQNHGSILLPIAILFLCGIAGAHPHMFIDVSLKFMLNDSGLSGFYVYWEFDEMNSAWIIEDHDKNRNLSFEKDEQKTIYEKAFIHAATQNYFMRVSWGQNMLDPVRVERFSASLNKKRFVVYSFFVPCDLALEQIAGNDLLVLFEDPTIYIAFTLQKELIQVSTNDRIEGKITFRKIDYSDAILLNLKRKPE